MARRAISFEKRRIARHRLVKQIDCPQRVRVPAKARPNDIIRARIEFESDEISGWLFLNSQSLHGCDFGVQSFSDLLAICFWIGDSVHPNGGSYCSAQTCMSERVSINCALRRRCVPVLRTLPSRTCDTRRSFPICRAFHSTAIFHHTASD